MTDTGNSGFGKFVPGFEFMQNLARQAAGGLAQGMQPATQLPSLGNWVAPTFNVEDLDKRIQELKTVHFWLDQNSRALAATIQALEVQKMTLATLQGMNVSMGDVANAMKIKTADAMASMAGFAGMGAKTPEGPAAAPASEADAVGSAGKVGGTQFAGLEIPPRRPPAVAPAEVATEPTPEPIPATPSPEAPASAPAATVVDPMQWWGALTQQFQTIAAQAMQELPGQTAVEAGKHMASALASEAVKTATEMTAGVARTFTAQADAVTQAKPGTKADSPAVKAGSKGRAQDKAAREATSGKATTAKVAAPATRQATRPSAAKKAVPGRTQRAVDTTTPANRATAKGTGTATARTAAKPASKTKAKVASKGGRTR